MNLNIPNILFSPRIITMPLVPFNGFVNGINIPNPPNRILIGHPEQYLVVPYPLINRFRIIDNNQPVILNSTNINDLINELNYRQYGNISNRLVLLQNVYWRNKYLKYKTKYLELSSSGTILPPPNAVTKAPAAVTKAPQAVKKIPPPPDAVIGQRSPFSTTIQSSDIYLPSMEDQHSLSRSNIDTTYKEYLAAGYRPDNITNCDTRFSHFKTLCTDSMANICAENGIQCDEHNKHCLTYWKCKSKEIPSSEDNIYEKAISKLQSSPPPKARRVWE